MAIDWDAELLAPVMAVFGEGQATDPLSWPTYHPQGGLAFQLPGAVFDEQYQRTVALGDGDQASTQHPVLGVRASLFLNGPKQGDIVTIPSTGKAFGIADVEPDGHGHILLILIEAGT